MGYRSFAGKVGALALVAGVAIATSDQPADAAQTTRSFTVTASITKMCSIAGTNLDFGSYTGSQVDGTATLTINCTNGSSPRVYSSMGLWPSAGWRRAEYNGDFVRYGLYTNAARTTPYPTAPPGIAAAANGVTNLTVYGRIPSGQNPDRGSHTDQVTFTLVY